MPKKEIVDDLTDGATALAKSTLEEDFRAREMLEVLTKCGDRAYVRLSVSKGDSKHAKWGRDTGEWGGLRLMWGVRENKIESAFNSPSNAKRMSNQGSVVYLAPEAGSLDSRVNSGRVKATTTLSAVRRRTMST